MPDVAGQDTPKYHYVTAFYLHSVYLVFLDTDIAEPENACRRTCPDSFGKRVNPNWANTRY